MAEFDEKQPADEREEAALAASRADDGEPTEADEGVTPAELGTDRYVFAAFFAAGITLAYLTGKILASIWNSLAEWPAAVRQVPALLRYAEDERPTYTMAVGVIVAIAVVARTVSKPSVRAWADGVASELAKVHWPKRETVTNGTVVVLAAGLFATLYIGLLDRLWGFVTMLVYGA